MAWHNRFCEPIFTFHHLLPSKIQTLYTIELRVREERPHDPVVRLADVFRTIMHGITKIIEPGVDRIGGDKMSDLAESPVNCMKLCKQIPWCVSYTWTPWVNNTGRCWMKDQVPMVSPGPPTYVSGVFADKYVCRLS
jgi:hypothetical protein